MRNLSLGYSPCPNDTFIFYALAHKKIRGDVEFSEILRDVETLNNMALRREPDVTKASFHAFGFLREDYCLLRAGSALGRGCGPLVVAKTQIRESELAQKRIAIPGKMTTAYLLLKLFDPEITDVIEMPFDQIMNAVSLGMVDAGLIIHEGRFTYPGYNLVNIIDLGEWWERETGLPVPLGGILARRELGASVIREIDRMIRESIEYAFQNHTLTRQYIKHNAQELDDEVIDRHIKLYVNDYTLDIGDGITAIEEMLKTAEELDLIPHSDKPVLTG
ncbi:putative periplasmic solute-binding protein [Candidatus Methanoperedens nitroreducens]|uniref:1,4-dihydroxy-6-naphtoate synthase n=1 Tax=Candidatus Methanoperedens nitratireducens TaxID=1392998 RepID=A0A062V2G2_9EURY|nr:1,4-dihydroxy-6-naphthoate synthase [Candidatus Methanoperedens nitroreducens]KCZ71557.1 putative periplasmic solute-binding protein [Candidatus Methanoperedens nitroreducens]MDJ1421184.1 1,4-dihydroxy-6-naphthoate synthase [Candidatus Methanoperedens sp.]